MYPIDVPSNIYNIHYHCGISCRTLYQQFYIHFDDQRDILCICPNRGIRIYIYGAVIAFISQQSHARILVMCVETGSRMSLVTSLLLQHSLSQPEADMAKSAPVLCVLLALLRAFIILLFLQYFSKPGDTFLSGRRLVLPHLASPGLALSCLVMPCLVLPGFECDAFSSNIKKWDSYGGVVLMRFFYFIYNLINHGW